MDYYYSQGISLEYVHPALKRNPFTKLLIKAGHGDADYGICFNISAYTPTTLNSDSILSGDRPFTATMSLKSFVVESDSIRQDRIASALTIGVIGPAAQGKEIQTRIHHWLNNILLRGWQYQVQNDILLNYQLNYEKKLLMAEDLFLLNVTGEARLGTVNDKLSGGFNFMTGHFKDPYLPVGRKKYKMSYYLYGQGRINLIGYDASLQGGLFNRNNPYTIPAADITRIVFQADAGLVLKFKKIYLSYS